MAKNYQTADEWMKKERGGSNASSTPSSRNYQTADEWMKKNAASFVTEKKKSNLISWADMAVNTVNGISRDSRYSDILPEDAFDRYRGTVDYLIGQYDSIKDDALRYGYDAEAAYRYLLDAQKYIQQRDQTHATEQSAATEKQGAVRQNEPQSAIPEKTTASPISFRGAGGVKKNTSGIGTLDGAVKGTSLWWQSSAGGTTKRAKPSVQLDSEQIASRRETLQKSYQDALNEAIEANPGVSLHNIPATDDMKFIREQMNELDAMEDTATYNKYQEMIASLSEKERKALEDSHGRDTTMAYGYLLQNGYSREDINAMYETMQREKNAAVSEEVLGSVYDFSGQNVGTGIAGFTGARVGNIVGGATGTFQAINDTAKHYLQGSPYRGTDPNALGYLPSRTASAADQGISDAIEGEDGGIVRQGAAFVYRGAASAADNLARMALSTAIGGGSVAGTGINSALSFTQGFQGSYREAQEKGGSPIQGLLVGAVDGGMEVFTESRTFERWMNLKDPELIGQGVYAWLKSAAVGIGKEITEEEASYIANTIADAVVMADKSESAEFIKSAVAAGKTPAEARWELVKKYAHEMAVTAADTAVSTLLMDGATGVVANHQYKRTYGGSAAELVQEGLESPEGTQSRTLAEQYQKKLDSGKTLSGGELRRLVNANEEQIAREEAEAEAASGVSDSGFSVRTDSERGSTVISFDEVPPKSVQEALKESGFQFANKDKVWYGQKSEEEARRVVLDAGGELYGKSEQGAEDAPGAQGEKAEEAADGAASSERIDESGESAADAGQDAIQKPFHVSDTYGTTLLNRPDGSTVETEIIGISSNEPGKLMLNVAGEDRPVSAANIGYSDAGEASLYYFINDMGLKPAAANMIVEEAKKYVNGTEGTVKAEKMAGFAQNIYGMYSLGKSGIPSGKAMSSEYAGELNEAIAEAGYQLGRRIYEQSVQDKEAGKQELAASQRARAAAGGKKINGVQYDGLNVRPGRDGSVEIEDVRLNEQQRTGIQAAELLGSMGVNIHVFQSRTNAKGKPIGENGSYHAADGSIHIDLNAGDNGQGVMAYTIAHEFTHFMEDQQPAQFQKFTDALFEVLETDVEADIVNKAEKLKRLHPNVYKNASQDRLTADARSEVIAEACETMLTDTDAAQRIAQQIQQQDSTLWEKIVAWFQDFARKLRDAYAGLNPDSKIARDAKETLQQVDDLVQMWADMAVDSAENYREGAGSENAEPERGVKTSSRENEDAAKRFSDEIAQWAKDGQDADRQFILGSTGTVLQGLGAIESDIYMNGDKISTILREHPEITLAEIQQIPKILNDPVLILKSRNAGRGGAQNTRMSMFGSVKAQNGQPFMVIFDLRPVENHFVVNDMQKVTSAYTKTSDAVSFVKSSFTMYADKKRTASLLRTIGFHTPIELLQSGFVGSISYNKQNVNLFGAKFSDVFNTQDSDDAIVYVKNKNEFDTLVGMADSIPVAYKGKIKFVGDSISQSGDDVNKKFSMRETVEETKDLVAVHNLTEEKLVKSLQLGGLPMPSIAIARARDGHSDFGEISLVFNKDTIDPEVRRSNKVYSGDAYTPTYPRVEYKASEDVKNRVYDRLKALRAKVDPYFAADIGRVSNDIDGMLQSEGGEEGLVAKAVKNYGLKAAYLEEQGTHIAAETRQEVKNAVDSAIDQKAFEQWVRELYRGVEEKAGIRNNKESFTPSGKRRSFEALHYEHNLENVVKAMREQGEKGIGVFGGGNIFGASTTEFSSVDQIKQSEDRLQKMSDEEYRKIKKGFSERFFELASSLPKNKDSFTAMDDAANMLIEAVTKYKTRSGMASYLKKESQGWANYSDYVVDDLVELVQDIRNMPTGYFEAKPQRAVGFEEVAAVIAPDTLSDETARMLSDLGQNVIFYAHENEESRLEALNSLEEVRFSDRYSEEETTEQQKDSGPYSYDSLVSKPDMAVTTVGGNVPNSRADVVYQAKQNARKIGKFNTKDGSVSVYVKDIGNDVVLGTPGLKHSLDRRMGVNAPVVLNAGEIIANSVRINEMTAQKSEASESYVLIGAARNNSGELYVVRSVVNRFSNELSDMDILYAINAKKEPAALLPQVYGGKSAPSTDSTISISELLDYVNEYFPDILPESVLKHYGHDARPTGKLGESALYSDRYSTEEKLTAQNEKLKADVANLRELLKLQGETTDGKVFKKDSLKTAVNYILRETGRSLDADGKAELADMLEKTYAYLLRKRAQIEGIEL